jgi:hypothetical protein
MDNRFITPKALRIGIFFFFAIPIGLNFFLMIPTGLNILGTGTPGGSTTLWLQFWAAYLSAAGSFCLAYMSYKVSKETLNQNTTMLMHNRWEQLIQRYEAMEKFVADMEEIHHKHTMETLYLMCESEKRVLIVRLTSAALLILRYMENDKGYMFKTQRGLALNAYGARLQKLNNQCVTYVNAIIYPDAADSKPIIARKEQILHEIENLYCSMMEAGKDLLQTEKSELRRFAQENKIPAGEFI